MKKLAILAALASLGAAAAVESSNTVGYYTKSIAKGKFGQLAVQFEAVGGGNAKVTDLFKTEDLVATEAKFDDEYNVLGESLNAAPQIQVWDGNKYTKYYYFSNAYDTETSTEVTGWADEFYGVILGDDVTIPVGQGVWVKAATSAATILQAGQVSDSSYEKACPEGKFVMLCNTRPEALAPNNADQIVFSGLVGNAAEFDDEYNVLGKSLNAAPQIQVWDGNKYTKYYYFSNAYDTETSTEVPGWADEFYGVLLGNSETIPVGQGFWFKAATGAVTVTINE